MKKPPKQKPLGDLLLGTLLLIAGLVYAGWWVFDHSINREYYSALDKLEAPIKAKYQDKKEKLSYARSTGIIKLEVEEYSRIKKQDEQAEYAELQQAKVIIDRQFGRRE